MSSLPRGMWVPVVARLVANCCTPFTTVLFCRYDCDLVSVSKPFFHLLVCEVCADSVSVWTLKDLWLQVNSKRFSVLLGAEKQLTDSWYGTKLRHSHPLYMNGCQSLLHTIVTLLCRIWVIISILSAISAASITCVCFPGYLIRCFSREFTPSVPLHLWQAVCTLCEQFSKHICGYLQLADIVVCCNSVLYCILMPMLGRFIFDWDQCLRLQSQSTV